MKRLLCLLIIPLLLCISCEKKLTSHSFFAMDTFISADIRGADDKLLKDLEKLVSDDEKRFSRTFSGCELYEFNKSDSGVPLSDETTELILRSLEISENTGGAFSPVMGALTDLWNIKSVSPRVPSETEIREALEHCDVSTVTVRDGVISKTDPETKLDLGAVAKGYSAGKCIDLLRENGITDALISFGGSIACIGNPDNRHNGWNIGIKNPFSTDELIGSIRMTDSYLAVSGAYERFFIKDGIRYHHISDPATGYPAQSDIESTAVISKDGTLSDALSTALFVMGSKSAIDLYKSGICEFEAILILTDGTVTVTDGIRDSFVFNNKATYTKDKYLVYN